MTQGLGRILSMDGTFRSKSGGKLHVLFQLDEHMFGRFFGMSRNVRVYRVIDIPKGGVGAHEFHKLRSELITAEKGSFKLILEGLAGVKKKVNLGEGMTYGIIHPFVFHTYVAQTSGASLQAVANTLYEHRQPATYDTYSESEFRKLQRSHGTRNR